MNFRSSLPNIIFLIVIVGLFLVFPQVALAQSEDGDALGGLSLTVCCGAVVLINIAILVWVIQDANNRGTGAGAWLLIVLIFGFLGLLAYLVARPQGKLVDCPNCGRKKPIRDQVCPHCGYKI
jgi:hypothetical protein